MVLVSTALLLFCVLLSDVLSAGAKNRAILQVPCPKKKWSWPVTGTNEWRQEKAKRAYRACDFTPKDEPNAWLRSYRFRVENATKVDVTLKYTVIGCGNFRYCKENLTLFVHKTSQEYDNIRNKVPDPYKEIGSYEKFASTAPSVLTPISGDLDKPENNETYSFLTNSSTPYYYLAIQYRGGCFKLFQIVLSYSFCPSISMSSSLVQLTETIAPAIGSIQVNGSCAENALPLDNNSTLYGQCMANGEWSSDATSGECWCKAGFGKYLNESGNAYCGACSKGTYQDTASNKSCIGCPSNSKENADNTMCECLQQYYRFDNESYVDNCTGPPSEPISPKTLYINATSVYLSWLAPEDLGDRTDLYYELECRLCNKDGVDCTVNCANKGVVISHHPKASRKAALYFMSPFTNYQFKVVAKNGMSRMAEMKDGRKPKFVRHSIQTNQSVPGIPVILDIEAISSTTVRLKWNLKEKNGIITFYQIMYYQPHQENNKQITNTTKSSELIKDLKAGKTYFFRVRASTEKGLGKPSIPKKVTLKPGTVPIGKELLIGIVAGVVGFLILVIVILVVCLYNRSNNSSKSLDIGNTNSWMFSTEMIPIEDGQKMYIDPSTYESPMEALLSNAEEIDGHDIKLEKSIGGGEFAEVYKGILKKGSDNEIVAIKILKPNASYKSREDFILEASIMGQFKHPNVIELKGVVTRSTDTPMMIVTEFMENGSLNHFLKVHDGKLTVLQLLGIARGVAAGMAYLSGINFIHRDLAARNILVADNMASKVSDFGLSRELGGSEDDEDSEYTTQGGKIPIRWTAPEAIRYRKFSSASDVWSFGVLLWEIMSFADRPYWEWDNFQVMDRVEEGYRLPAPVECPKSIHNIMLDCWEADKNNRPRFPDIVTRLDELIRSPEKITDDAANARYTNTNKDIKLEDETPVQEWLESISMARYVNSFAAAGYVDVAHVKSMEEDDLTRIGVNLIGHRNKIRKSIKGMKMQLKAPKIFIESEEKAFI